MIFLLPGLVSKHKPETIDDLVMKVLCTTKLRNSKPIIN